MRCSLEQQNVCNVDEADILVIRMEYQYYANDYISDEKESFRMFVVIFLGKTMIREGSPVKQEKVKNQGFLDDFRNVFHEDQSQIVNTSMTNFVSYLREN